MVMFFCHAADEFVAAKESDCWKFVVVPPPPVPPIQNNSFLMFGTMVDVANALNLAVSWTQCFLPALAWAVSQYTDTSKITKACAVTTQ